jgi:hypothetical protein
MEYYKWFLEVFFYGLILFAILFIISDIFDHIHHRRRKIRHTLRIIKVWY